MNRINEIVYHVILALFTILWRFIRHLRGKSRSKKLRKHDQDSEDYQG